ncbi:MAG: hypothetical protein H6981_01190 [Gammaproteobacteria bacterium]|nr:hypothetical protein [Gammaproteobacteria bacterium]MCP5135400.1 hypothetical protein [Gammaproteobacteria bacterium]
MNKRGNPAPAHAAFQPWVTLACQTLGVQGVASDSEAFWDVFEHLVLSTAEPRMDIGFEAALALLDKPDDERRKHGVARIAAHFDTDPLLSTLAIYASQRLAHGD